MPAARCLLPAACCLLPAENGLDTNSTLYPYTHAYNHTCNQTLYTALSADLYLNPYTPSQASQQARGYPCTAWRSAAAGGSPAGEPFIPGLTW